MTRQTKTITGISVITVLSLIYHIAHLTNTITEFNSSNAGNTFKNAPVNIIIRDSYGNTDTMSMEKYLLQQQPSDSVNAAN